VFVERCALAWAGSRLRALWLGAARA
jgi:hypothetical protein